MPETAQEFHKPPAEPLLSPDLLRKLDRWGLVVRRATAGQYSGERRSKRHGHSVEFADFRNYVPGDDLRFLDWNLYARMERLYLKLFLHEQELNVHIVLDLSESMRFGDPPKAWIAKRLAAALGYLALAHQDGLSITVGSTVPARFRLSRGKAFVHRMIHFLENAREGGGVSLPELLDQTLRRIRRPGLVILLTDFLGKEGCESALKPIIARRHEALILHVLDKEEWDPTVRGDLKLIDSEDGSLTEITANPAMLDRYRRRARAWSEQIDQYCTRRGMTYVRIVGDATVDEVVLKSLRRLGRIA